MPKGPKGEKRPADVIGNAVKVMKIATGEIDEDTGELKKMEKVDAAKLGGKARAKALSPSKRSEIAKKAARKRWQSQNN